MREGARGGWKKSGNVMINNICKDGKGMGRALVLKKYSVGNYEAGSNLSEEGFHYL